MGGKGQVRAVGCVAARQAGGAAARETPPSSRQQAALEGSLVGDTRPLPTCPFLLKFMTTISRLVTVRRVRCWSQDPLSSRRRCVAASLPRARTRATAA